jgi:hypothetical protein
MVRAKWIGAAAVTAALGSVLFVRACDPLFTTKPTDFSYAGHERPRVFVAHHPLVPRPGTELTIRLEPDLAAGGVVRHAKAVLRDPASGTSETRTCSAAGEAFECRFTLGSASGPRIYGGFVELEGGRRVDSRTDYRFTVADEIALNTFIEVRVPENKVQGLGDRHRIDTSFVRDPQNYGLDAFIADVEQALYGGLLADPVYRWRDDQLGFAVFTYDAFVTSYYSGLNTRCGQNPWPLDATFTQPLVGIEVVGVLHRKATDTQGVEGGVAAVTPGLFRDCAGTAARSPGVRTFSASMGLTQSPFIAKHEFGHAAFELGDEYNETNATRNVTAAQPPQTSECCCMTDDGPGGVGGTGTGIGGIGGSVTPRPGLTPLLAVKRCFGPDGPTTQPGSGLSLPSCEGSSAGLLAQNCGAKPDGGCPLIASQCVASLAWRGPPPPGVTTERLNVFPTEAACNDALPLVRGHPGVEDAGRSLGACRQLCGTPAEPCPCPGQSEAWIVDNNPRVAPTNPRDAMASVSDAAEVHGGTCAWCVETTLCARWHRALGDSAEKSWQTCAAPGLAQGLVAAFVQALEDFFRHIVF